MKELADGERIPVYAFSHKEKKERGGEISHNRIRSEPGVRDAVVFIGVGAREGDSIPGREGQRTVRVRRDKTVYVNHYYFYIDDADFGHCLSRCAVMRPGASSCA